MFQHQSFQDVQVELFGKAGGAQWVKLAEHVVERQLVNISSYPSSSGPLTRKRPARGADRFRAGAMVRRRPHGWRTSVPLYVVTSSSITRTSNDNVS
jgi:hypothetical protein